MPRKKKSEETIMVEWCEPNMIASSAKLEQENMKLQDDIDKLLGAIVRQEECIKLLVSYLDAPVKARGKLADVERLLR